MGFWIHTKLFIRGRICEQRHYHRHTRNTKVAGENREEIAEHMIALIGQLYREKNIVVSVYGRSLINRSVIQILKTHRRTRVVDVELSVVNTFPILEALAKIENIGSAEVDIGKLAVEYKEKGGDIDAFVAQAVESIKGNATSEQP